MKRFFSKTWLANPGTQLSGARLAGPRSATEAVGAEYGPLLSPYYGLDNPFKKEYNIMTTYSK
jgi:hypothetical protein